MAETIKTTLALDGETKLKDAIKSINKEYSVLKSEMALVTSAYDKNDSSAEKLIQVNEVLNKQIDIQKKKVEELENGLKQAADRFGENSTQAKEYEIQINQAKTSLNKMEQEVRANSKAIDDNAAKTDNAAAKTSNWGEKLKSVSGTLGAGFAAAAKGAAVAVGAIAAATGAAITGIAKAGIETGNWADDLITLSAKTGINVGTLQEMEYASRFVDVEVETMTGSMAKLIKSMDNARDGGKNTSEAFDTLGISLTDNNGQLRDNKDVWYEAIDALGQIENETERDAAAMAIFGKSAQDLNPLIEAGAGAMQLYAEQAREAGLVLSDEMVAKLGEFDDVMEKTEAQMDGLKKQLAVIFLPVLQDVGTGISEVLSGIGTALSDGFQPEDVKTIGKLIGRKLIDGIKEFSKFLPDLISTVSSVLTELVNVIVAILPELLPALMDGATQLLQGMLDAITANVEPLVAMVVDLLTKLAQFLIDNLPVIIEAGIQILIALAQGILEALPDLIPAAIEMVMKIVDTLMNNLSTIIDVAIQIILAVVDGLIEALPQLIEWLPTIVNTIVQVIVENLPLLIDAAIQIMLAIMNALIENLPLIFDAAIEIITAILEGIVFAVPELMKYFPTLFASIANKFGEFDWMQLGKDLINGIIEGIKAMASRLADAVGDAVSRAISWAKKLLGINSPSRVARDEVGLQIGRGIAVGLDQSGKEIDAAMANALPDLQRQYDVQFAAQAIQVRRSGAASTQPILDIDYDRLASAVSRLTLAVDGREFGRLIESYG